MPKIVLMTALWVLAWAMLPASAQVPAAQEPAVPAGMDPGGVAIALLGPGVDYTKPEVARLLARDGEGEPIAWDCTDDDARPFDGSGTGATDALAIAQSGTGVRLVIVKEAAGDVNAFGRMVLFAVQTPARVIVWPGADAKRPDWPLLDAAAKRFPQHLFVVPDTSVPILHPNVFVAPKVPMPARAATLALAIRIAQILAAAPALPAAEIKAKLAVPPGR